MTNPSCCLRSGFDHTEYDFYDHEEYDDGKNEDVSIGDYVKGLHGGKYQFDAPTGLSFAGQEFVESLYGGGSDDGIIMDDVDSNDVVIPNWFLNLQPPPLTPTPPALATGVPAYHTDAGVFVSSLSLQRSDVASSKRIVITNGERTWEKFYTKILPVGDDDRSKRELPPSSSSSSSFFEVEPSRGTLAPRGVKTERHSDTAVLRLKVIPPSPQGTNNNDDEEDNPNGENNGCRWWLIVATEEEKWFYQITTC